VKRGEIMTSIDELARQVGLAPRTVERRLEILVELGSITQRVNHRGRIISLTNFDAYQALPDELPPDDDDQQDAEQDA
jgi:DNA-binding transcriptional regulator YhcF (GntR family)